MHILDENVAVGCGNFNIGEVPNSLNTVGGKRLGYSRSGCLGNGENSNINRVLLQIALELIHTINRNSINLSGDLKAKHWSFAVIGIQQTSRMYGVYDLASVVQLNALPRAIADK